MRTWLPCTCYDGESQQGGKPQSGMVPADFMFQLTGEEADSLRFQPQHASVPLNAANTCCCALSFRQGSIRIRFWDRLVVIRVGVV